MMSGIAANGQGVGEVEMLHVKIPVPEGGWVLESGQRLPELTVAYETYGTLNAARDNAVFICHALSGDAHVAGVHAGDPASVGWWDPMVGPGRGIDTNHFFVICANVLGGCRGTTGPASTDPRTGKPYGSAFPAITVGDMVNVHRRLMEELHVEHLAAVIGGSFGGMQALEWALRYPGMVKRCIFIASAMALSAQALAFDIVGRRAITSDPAWHGGDYYAEGSGPVVGLAQARMIGHITYLSQTMMTLKFGRDRKLAEVEALPAAFRSDFQVESYLEHQGAKFVGRFDANSYLHITRAMDEYDVAARFGSQEKVFASIQAKVLVVALSEDWLFPTEQSMELGKGLLAAGRAVSYCSLHAPHGHDAFLVDIENLTELIRAFLPWVHPAGAASVMDRPMELSGQDEAECGRVAAMIRQGSRVLDLGCGDGLLMEYLARHRGATCMGLDIDLEGVIGAIDRGFDVFQADMDEGLSMIPDGSYDYALLHRTLQVVRKPRLVLRELLRVAREGIVVFPNFGQWRRRLQLLWHGCMPKGAGLPFEWYDTPNIHLFTLHDFMGLCREDGIRILEVVGFDSGRAGRLMETMGFKNLGAGQALVRISRS